MAIRLSDDELRKSLQDYGEDVGPVTHTTRAVMERRLKNLQKVYGPIKAQERSLNPYILCDSESAASSRVRKNRTFSRNESSQRPNINPFREFCSWQESDIFIKPSPMHIPILRPEPKTQNYRYNLHHDDQYGGSVTRSIPGRSPAFDCETSDSNFDSNSLRNESSQRLNINPFPEFCTWQKSNTFINTSPVHIPILCPEPKTQNYRYNLHHDNQFDDSVTRSNPGASSAFDYETSNSNFDSNSLHSIKSSELQDNSQSSVSSPHESHSKENSLDCRDADYMSPIHFTSSQDKSKQELDTLSENFKNLFINKYCCDTTLYVKDKEYKAHKAVLIARSPVFAAMFLHDTSEKQTGIVNISDCDPDSFEVFLEFLYCGKLDNLSFRNALHLYETSDKYDVQGLKSFCIECLLENLSVENVCDIIAIADKYDELNVMAAAQNFFNENFDEIFDTSEWDSLVKYNYRLSKKLLKGMSSKIKSAR